MAWITPKTDWVDTDYFSFVNDYSRIKGNIEELYNVSLSLYMPYEMTTMEDVVEGGFPHASFFNKVVNALENVQDNCFTPLESEEMRTYNGNERAWNADELNVIENNSLLLYKAFDAQTNALRQLAFSLGEMEDFE